MSNILNRQKQLAMQARLQREQVRARPTVPLPPKMPAGPLEGVSQEGIALGRRHTVKIGSRRKRISSKKTKRRHGQRTAKNKTRK
jgi:hypothetical protein